MKKIGLDHEEIRMIRAVLRHVPDVREGILFGSRAQLTHRRNRTSILPWLASTMA